MPDLTDSSDNKQVNEEPFLVLGDNPATQFRTLFAEPTVSFCNVYESYYAWMGWMFGFIEFPCIEQLNGLHRQNAMLLSSDVETWSTDSDSED